MKAGRSTARGSRLLSPFLHVILYEFFCIFFENVVDFINQLTFQPVLSVALASLSRLQADHAAVRRAFLRFVQISGLATIPVFVGLALIAEPLFALMLGPQWAPAVPLYGPHTWRHSCVSGWLCTCGVR